MVLATILGLHCAILGPSWGLCWPMLGLFSWFCTFLPRSSCLLSALCFILLPSFPLLACSAGLLSSFVCFFLFFLWLPPATCLPFLTFAACLLLPYPLWLSLAPCLLFTCFFLFCLLFLQLACSCSLLFVLLLLLLLVPASALLASCLAAGSFKSVAFARTNPHTLANPHALAAG